MVIIDVNLASFPNFYELFKELMLEGYQHFPSELREYFLKRDYAQENFAYWLEKNYRKMIIATETSSDAKQTPPVEIKGFLVGDHTYGGVGFISWLGVKKEFRKQGIGTQLLKVYEIYARSKKAHLLELYTSENNVNFYQNQGFSEIGRRQEGFYGQKNIIMNKPLGHFDENLIRL